MYIRIAKLAFPAVSQFIHGYRLSIEVVYLIFNRSLWIPWRACKLSQGSHAWAAVMQESRWIELLQAKEELRGV